ncbi:hypothetical protein N9K16_05785 [Alphaproteobacteria bacterium]|nr:hypothetical protein [Alphaproteobacteria bacterium]
MNSKMTKLIFLLFSLGLMAACSATQRVEKKEVKSIETDGLFRYYFTTKDIQHNGFGAPNATLVVAAKELKNSKTKDKNPGKPAAAVLKKLDTTQTSFADGRKLSAADPKKFVEIFHSFGPDSNPVELRPYALLALRQNVCPTGQIIDHVWSDIDYADLNKQLKNRSKNSGKLTLRRGEASSAKYKGDAWYLYFRCLSTQ